MENSVPVSEPYMCESCKFNRGIDMNTAKVRCIAKSYLASWRHMRRKKCKHYREGR